MVVITVTIPTEIGNRYHTEVRISRVTVQTSKSEAPLIKSSNVTLPSRGRRLRVATESPQRTFTSTPSIIFGYECCQRRSSAPCHAPYCGRSPNRDVAGGRALPRPHARWGRPYFQQGFWCNAPQNRPHWLWLVQVTSPLARCGKRA